MLYITPPKIFTNNVCSSFAPQRNEESAKTPEPSSSINLKSNTTSSLKSASLRGYDAGSVSPDPPIGSIDQETLKTVINETFLNPNQAQQLLVLQPTDSYTIL